MKRRLALASLIIGLCLLGLGLAWDGIMPTSVYWGPEQATALVQAQIEAHAKSHYHEDEEAHQKAAAAARARYDRLRERLEAARGSRRRSGLYLTAGGIALLLAGIGLHLTAKSE
jgi:hypothetical protein